MGAGVVSQAHGTPSEPREDIFQEMEFQEIVEKQNGNDQKAQQVVPKRYQSERIEQQAVGVDPGSRRVAAIQRRHERRNAY